MLVARNLTRLGSRVPKDARVQQRRLLSLHEYQGQELLREFGVSVPRGKLARTSQEVKKIMEELGGPCVIKSQILKGGRKQGIFDSGLQGGVQFARSPEAGATMAEKMLGHRLKTKQTAETGLLVNKLYVAETMQFDDEWYLAITWDRESYQPVVIVSRSGGIDIENTANDDPNKIQTFGFQISDGITDALVSRITDQLSLSSQDSKSLEDLLVKLLALFLEKDATMLEINPMVRSSGGLTCLDAKFTFDDAAEKRQKELFGSRDIENEVPEEVEAAKHGLVYVRMDGNIGNIVNGAGLAMATNDAIAHYGGSSANFLDAGGQATKETMLEAFKIILKDSRVTTILVNVYGGIIRCDMIAESIIAAAKQLGSLPVPLVVRLQGTRSEEGLKLLESANLGLHVEADFGKAAERAVVLARGAVR